MTTKKNSRTEREGKLSCAKCCDTLLKFQNSKAPGNDGLTGEFIQGFWNLLSQQLTDSLNFSFEHGELSTHRNKLLFDWLIDKKDRDRRYIKNWPPISLLNVDVKLASKALALYVRSKFIIPLGISALWWLAESSIIEAYFFGNWDFFKYKPYEKSNNFLTPCYLT